MTTELRTLTERVATSRSAPALRIHPPRTRPRHGEPYTRRAVNVLVAAVGIIVTLPLMLVIAVLIKLTSRGPVLFTQLRVGLDQRALSRAGGNTRRSLDMGGRPFVMYKFRTMRADDSHAHREVWASPDDARVTLVGRFLRACRLDELPQLLNVLKGEMNVVGPRPEQPTIFVQLREQVEGYQRRQRARPGITGWAQINHHYDRSIDDVRKKVSFDLEYIRRQSAREDLKIMACTLPVMLFRRGGW